MPSSHPAGESKRDRPLATYFESLPRESAERGTFSPDDVAETVRQDRNGTSR